ncbi:hypothetical protein [Bosea sp. (in: a-proteobacteria)]|uniref:hypothetical protein n=1 Tax=Bosea sp. (in: a-proteobacteria) TaxID=1871050 RepID=UPI002732F4F7|nr:hypothetical protein [Bosea sp. (in: a-proteobacteria)]MDP3256713.1 hypothetical protein [Bosea sp. (in: a-proteobacteria)]
MTIEFTQFRLSYHDRIVINKIAYKRRRRLANGYALERVDDPDTVETFSDYDLHVASRGPDYRFDLNAFAESKAHADASSTEGLLSWLPDAQQETALWRADVCREVMKRKAARTLSLTDVSLKQNLPGIVDELYKDEKRRSAKRNAEGEAIKPKAGDHIPGRRQEPSPRTLRKWLRWFREAGDQAIALRHRYYRSGNRETQRLAREERQMLHDFSLKYMSETRPTKRDIHRLMKAHILEEVNPQRVAAGQKPLRVPSYERLAAEINSFPEFDTHACRYGLDAAKKHFAMVQNGVDVERPLQRVEIDEWRINLQALCADLGILDKLSDKLKSEIATARPWLCAALDAATRVCVGFKIALTPSADLALDVLEMIVTPKAPYAIAAGARSRDEFCGSPERIVHDQGAAFLSLKFRRAIIDLGADADAPPAGIPSLRGRIERFFKTASMQALAPFTGRTFESAADKGDYKPEARASLTLQELCDVITCWVLDRYHHSQHSGLQGETPANCWKRLVKQFQVIPHPDSLKRRAVFGLKHTHRLTSKGVRAFGLYFNCEDLQAYRRRLGDVMVEMRLHHLDLGYVSVRRADGGWLSVPNTRPGFDNVPLEIWQAAAADLRRRFKAEAMVADNIVAKAILAAWDLSKAAGARVSIFSTRPNQEQLDYAEKELGFGFGRPAQLTKDATSSSGSLLEGSVPTGSREVASTNLPSVAPKSKTRSFKITD